MPHTHSLKIKNALHLMGPLHASSASKPQAVKAGLTFTSLPKKLDVKIVFITRRWEVH